MLIQQVDHFGVEALQCSFRYCPNPFRLAVCALGRHSVFKAELRCDYDLVTDWRQRLANDFLVRKRTVCFGGVEEGHAAIISGANYFNGFTLFGGRAKAEA